jgi:hypothetical protein
MTSSCSRAAWFGALLPMLGAVTSLSLGCEDRSGTIDSSDASGLPDGNVRVDAHRVDAHRVDGPLCGTGDGCDDGDPCTRDDVCGSGVCAGTVVACITPPPAECVGSTLRIYAGAGTCSEGDCTYSYSDTVCPDGCRNGACACTPVDWTTETVVADGSIREFSSIAVDAANGVHIAYYDSSAEQVRYAHRAVEETAWTFETAAPLGRTSRAPYLSLALDATGGSYVTYRDVGAGGVGYAYRLAGGAWDTRAVETTGDGDSHPSIAIDGSGNMHVFYYDNDTSEVRYAHGPPGGALTTVAIDRSFRPDHDNAIAVDTSGAAHFAYFRGTEQDLAYQRVPALGGEGTADSSGSFGYYVSIATDPAGGVHIGYQDYIDDDLHYAYRPAAGAWTTETADAANVTGSYVSIEADRSGNPHISYRESGDGALRYAYRSAGGAWTAATVDTEGDTGYATSLALDSLGTAHISYWEAEGGDLHYARGRVCPAEPD